jgi:glutamyl-tRNA synthetase
LKNSVYSDKDFTDEYLLKVIEAMRERVNFAKDFINNSPYFFEDPESYDETVISKRWKEDSPVLLKKLNDEFASLDNPAKEDYEAALKKVAESESTGVGKLIHPLRLAVSGMGGGPGVYDILVIIGKEKTISRINKAIAEIKP